MSTTYDSPASPADGAVRKAVLLAKQQGHRQDPQAPATEETTEQAPAALAAPRVRIELAGWEMAVLGVVLLLGVAMAGIGLASSYAAVAKKAAEDWGWTHPWMLPVAVDVSIIAFSLGHLALIRFERRAAWVRLLPVGLTALTIWLNWNTGNNAGGKASHAGVVIVWVGFTEYVAHLYAAHIAKLKGLVARDEIPPSRWILNPPQTAMIARLMRLWDLTYTETLELIRQRKVYEQRLTQRHGKQWRTTADANELLPLRLARWGLTVEQALAQPAAEDAADALRKHEAELQRRALRLRMQEEEATEALRAVELEAQIAAAKSKAKAAQLLAEAEEKAAEEKARTAADAVLRAHERALRIQEAEATAAADRLQAEAEAQAAKVAAEAEAEAARIRRESENAQLKWQMEQDELRRQAAEKSRLEELEAARRAEAAKADIAREAAEADAQLSELNRQRAEADKAAAEAAKSAAVAREQASVAARNASVAEAAKTVAEAEATRRAAEEKRRATEEAALAAELERSMAEALEAASVAADSARRSPAERQALIVADMIERFGEEKVTLRYIGEQLGLPHGTAQDRRDRARQILANRRDGQGDAVAA